MINISGSGSECKGSLHGGGPGQVEGWGEGGVGLLCEREGHCALR